MRIIRQGKLPEMELFEVTCDRCKTLFEFEKVEAKITSDQRDGDFMTIDCPLCHKPVTVDVDYNKPGAYRGVR